MNATKWIARCLVSMATAVVVPSAWCGGYGEPGVMPSGSQTEQLGTINRVRIETAMVWIGGQPYHLTESTRCFVDEKPMTSITQLRVGQRAAFQSLKDGSLVVLVVSSED